MANVNVTSNAWTEISITSGTVQNISATADIELSAEQTDNSGVVLKPSEIYQWDNETIYARAVTEETGALRVVNFKKAAGGGGYVLPVASASTLGGVKVGNNLSIDASGVLSANAGGYTLPPATASTLGGVIVGDNITVDANGEISVAAPYSLPKAAAGTLGGVKIGSNVNVDGDGVISVAAPYSLPTAAADTLGGVKIGDNITIDANGAISATSAYTLPPATASTLGGVIVGDNISVDANGEISTHAPYSLPAATANDLGGVKIGSNVNVDANGVISVAAPYSLPTATANDLGGVKIGSNLSIDAGGVLSAVGGGSTSYSTTEQVIGTWIDGKPVYQITNEVSFSNKAVGSFDWIRLVNRTDINLDRLIFSYAKIIFDGHSNDEYIAPYYAIGSFSGVDNTHPAAATLATSNVGVSVQLQQYFYNDTLSGKIVFTIQYTKTTD